METSPHIPDSLSGNDLGDYYQEDKLYTFKITKKRSPWSPDVSTFISKVTF